MVSEINQTPKSLRLHIGVFGDTNAGKSTFINFVTGQNVSITSPVAGTTTDPVFKPMELLPIGPVVFIDTAGLDDIGELGNIRINKTLEQLEQCDVAVLVINGNTNNISSQNKYIDMLSDKKIPFIVVVNEIGGSTDTDFSKLKCKNILKSDLLNTVQSEFVKKELIKLFDKKEKEPLLTGDLVNRGDTVLLVMPQDIQAPKGRLILPQVQVLRDLLDNGCITVNVTPENICTAIENMKTSPSLVITDSQIFKDVNQKISSDIRLTSFSLLMAKIKGDMNGFINGAKAIDLLENGDKVLILESCTHHAMNDDIARVKIPMLLKKYTCKELIIDNISGQVSDIDISKYKLAIHCGGCMINRKAMIARQKMFESMSVPLTNFGVAIAYMNGILDRVC